MLEYLKRETRTRLSFNVDATLNSEEGGSAEIKHFLLCAVSRQDFGVHGSLLLPMYCSFVLSSFTSMFRYRFA